MKIAIIGTGNVGKALAGSFLEAGHEVTMAARDEAKTRLVADGIGARTAATPRIAAESAEVIVLAVPFVTSARDVAAEIEPVVAGKVVVDPTNPAKADFSGLATEHGPSAGEQIAAWLPEARVVKAFNTLFGSNQADPASHETTIDGLYATDDETARSTIATLEDSMGLRPVDAGPLARSRELEALAWLNITLQMRHGGDWTSAFVLVDAPAAATTVPERRAA